MRKTRLLFLIHDKFVNNFESIYNSVKNSNEFEMTVVACDSLPTDYKGKTSSKEISDYIKSRNIDCIDAFDYQTNSWIDLAQFKADYIFVSTPYDIYRPKEYSSYRLSMIAKLCSVAYAATTNIDNDFLLSNPFFYNCSYFFICDENEKTFSEQMKTSPLNKKFVPIGCVKLDKYLFGEYKTGNWEKLFPHTENNLRITWKPRWCQENTEIFFDFLEGLINYSKKHDVDVLLLEHPLFRDTLKSKGLLKKYEDNKHKNVIINLL